MGSTDIQQQVEREVRASLAFEHMIAAAVTAAGVSALGAFGVRLAQRLIEGSLGAASFLRTAAEGAFFGICVFLASFMTALAVFTPIYVFTEKHRLRNIWPFHLAAFGVSMALLFGLGLAPGFEAPQNVLYLIPGFLTVTLFGRRIAPLWRAADKAAAAFAPPRLVQ